MPDWLLPFVIGASLGIAAMCALMLIGLWRSLRR